MNKKMLIAIVAIVLIVVLAIYTGVNLSNKNAEPVSGVPTQQPSATSTNVVSTPTSEIESPLATEEPQETQTPEPTPIDVSKMTAQQKEEYAINISKEAWQKLNTHQKVYYSIATIDSDGDYIVTVRAEENTNALAWYKINVSTGSCNAIN